MRRWFEYQIKNQRDPYYVPGTYSSPYANILSTMKQEFDFIKKIYNTPRTTCKTESVFSSKYRYTDSLTKNVPNLPKSTLDEWVYDKDYEVLLDRSSHEVVYFHEHDDQKRILDSFCTAMAIDKALTKPGMSSIKLHVQHPGQIFPLHIDRPQHFDFEGKPGAVNNMPVHSRFLVFIEDQKPGQLFQMDDQCLNWSAGDVFTWNARDTMHGSSNVGYWPRFMLMFTIKIQT